MLNQKLEINPWWEMWVRPRKTIQAVTSYDNKHGFIGLSFLYGLSQGAYLAQAFSLGESFPLWILIISIVVLAIPIGVISFTVFSLVIYWTGKLIRGRACYHDIRAAVSWSNVTMILSVIFIGLMILTFGQSFFYRSFADTDIRELKALLLTSFLLIEFALAVWRLILFVIALAEVQHFSGWMAVLNVILVGVVYFIFIFLLDKCLTWIGGNSIGLA